MQMLRTWVAAKLKLCDTFNYRLWGTMIGMWPSKELVQHPATLLNLSTSTNFRTCYTVSEADLRLTRLLTWSSLQHQGWYTHDVHENCLIFRTTPKGNCLIFRNPPPPPPHPSPPPDLPCLSTSKTPWTPNFKRTLLSKW